MNTTELNQTIQDKTRSLGHSLRSRIHPMSSMAKLWVKRDDELSFGVSGTKLRKIAALVHHWRENGVKKVIALGGDRSNHLVSCVQIFHEIGLDYEVWCQESHHQSMRGNQAYLRLLARPGQSRSLSREDWPHAQREAEAYAQSQADKTVVMAEGACQEEALWGGMSLGMDLLLNQAQEAMEFDHIFMDAGTGIGAAGMKAYLDAVGFKGVLHVVQMAPCDIQTWASKGSRLLGLETSATCELRIHQPATARSFGASNTKVMEEIVRFAREDGLLLDPIYTAKLFLTVRQLLPNILSPGQIGAVIHSGGGLAIEGFWEQLGRHL
ncbi:pyridoxal-phosphate dependent enzyme [Pseudobacteriovorax antillogorgiicola]|uniref:D-cysteine desulfhydrase n=1 Tax=Pseudobacteriovorax antillogorgiicola TaxID=1513793 RepID=A0A1Y6CGS8_9BACT|nr:pyridoxal-phosphate dependent enzyme [Pseudobacteriovorax antillogorgiicola]TCS47339.1 D-cysteine desulfhydrase [Pseudobacteriovorax antillogorgiicola]SMF63121.1 D-cysteine desulfhydrase [Pseudobacteriovorax antillogorgiicola]